MMGRVSTPQRIGRDVRTDQPVQLRPGDAQQLRSDCQRGFIICPLPDCKYPSLTTVVGHFRAGHWVQDFFRHLRIDPAHDEVHDGESAEHWLAKYQLADWLERQGHDVDIETRVTSGLRKPDVSVRAFGQRWAIEVQYSPISQDLWNRRTTELGQAGYRTWWIWGRRNDRTVDLTSAMRTNVEQHGEAWFIKTAIDQLPVIGTGLQTGKWRGAQLTAPASRAADRLAPHWSRLESISFEADGPTDHPANQAITECDQRHRIALLSAIASALALHTDSCSERLRRSLRQSRPRPVGRPLPAIVHERGLAGSAWSMPTDLTPGWADAVTHESRHDEAVFVNPRIWKSEVVGRLEKKPPGITFSVGNVVRNALGRYARTTNDAAVEAAVQVFLDHLVKMGRLEATNGGRYCTIDIRPGEDMLRSSRIRTASNNAVLT
jgi:hypothetical protein